MPPRRIRDLLDRVTGIRDPCDLDLLVFFHRHPRAMLTSERLAVYVGYELPRVAKSLETLIAAGLLTRVQRPTGSARMYVLGGSGQLRGWLESLLRLVSTREGRLAALAELARRPPEAATSGGPEPPLALAQHDRHAHARDARELRHA